MTAKFVRFSLLLLLSTLPTSFATAADHWVGTWATSPMAAKNPTAKFGAEGTDGTTLREIVHISLGGSPVRAIFTNELGLDPLTIGAAQIALSTKPPPSPQPRPFPSPLTANPPSLSHPEPSSSAILQASKSRLAPISP